MTHRSKHSVRNTRPAVSRNSAPYSTRKARCESSSRWTSKKLADTKGDSQEGAVCDQIPCSPRCPISYSRQKWFMPFGVLMRVSQPEVVASIGIAISVMISSGKNAASSITMCVASLPRSDLPNCPDRAMTVCRPHRKCG